MGEDEAGWAGATCTVPALSWHSNELPSSVYSSLCHSMQIRRSQAHEHDHLNIFEIFYFTRIDTQLSLNDEKTLRGFFKKTFLFKTAFWMHLCMCSSEHVQGWIYLWINEWSTRCQSCVDTLSISTQAASLFPELRQKTTDPALSLQSCHVNTCFFYSWWINNKH